MAKFELQSLINVTITVKDKEKDDLLAYLLMQNFEFAIVDDKNKDEITLEISRFDLDKLESYMY